MKHARLLSLALASSVSLVFSSSLAFAADPPTPAAVTAPKPADAKPTKVAEAKPAKPEPPKPALKSAQVQQSLSEAKRLSDAFVAVAEHVSPSVVQIDTTTRDESESAVLRWLGRQNVESPIARGTGSGVVLSADGAILTNNHVVDEALSISVHLRDGRFVPAKILGRDPETDLAVIKVDATGLTPATLGDSDAARVGEWVVAIGSPFNLGYSVTTGVLSAKGRGGLGMNAIEDYLQTDASINPGNSGGPLCDLEGKVLGINTMIVGRGSGIGFAVPSSLAQHVAQQLVTKGHVERAWIGVTVQDTTPELAAALKVEPHSGAIVNHVDDKGPGKTANLKPSDVIAKLGDKPMHDARELVREVLAHDVGQSLTMEIVRDGKHYQTSITLAARPEHAIPPAPVQQQGVPHVGLGMSVRDLDPRQSEELGLPARPLPVITAVVPGSAADRAGLRQNDVIIESDGAPFATSNQVQEHAKDGHILVLIRRGPASFYAALHK